MGYSRFDRPLQSTQRFFNAGSAPVTMTVIALNILIFLAGDFPRNAWWIQDLICNKGIGEPFHIWTLITYPLVTLGFIPLLFACLWMYGVGGFLERGWGRGRYLLFFGLCSLISSCCMLVGSLLLHLPFILAGLWIPLAALTVAWAAIDPYQDMLFYFVIKLQARWVALITVGLIFFGEFYGEPVLGLFALVGCLFAYLWVRGRVPYPIQSAFDSVFHPRPRRGPDLRFYDADRKRRRSGFEAENTQKRGLLGKYRDWQQRKKLEKLWKASGLGDDDDVTRRRR